MIKRKNGKKKGFSLIELIIVLAVMAIIALIAIPNLNSVKEKSKKKADDETCKTIERSIMTLITDDTVEVTKDISGLTFTVSADGTKGVLAGDEVAEDKDISPNEKSAIEDALSKVNRPQQDKSKPYKISILKDGNVTCVVE